MGDPEKAVESIKRLLESYESDEWRFGRSRDPNEIEHLYRYLASLYTQMGNSELAQFYNERAQYMWHLRFPAPGWPKIETPLKISKKPAPENWKQESVKHREKFENLLDAWKRTSDSITIIADNGVCFEDEFLIGRGSYGTNVYVCLGGDGIERAIKCLPKSSHTNHERDILTSKNVVNSPRIINYYFSGDASEKHTDYLILDLYEQNLEEYIQQHKDLKDEIKAPQIRKMVRQVLEGLKALHSREPRILHRDLKPANILIDKEGDLVLSDFGIGRILQGPTYFSSRESGSRGWIPYECIDWKRMYSEEACDQGDNGVQLKWKEKSDIQAAGMVAFYICTKGKHPFGPQMNQLQNLHDDNPVGLKNVDDPALKDLLSQMLVRDLDKRPYVEQALQHPYFLSSKEQIRFIETVGNEREIKMVDETCDVVQELDNLNPSKPRGSLFPKNWKANFYPDDLNTLCGSKRPPSKLDGCRYTHCLRFIRNVRQHWRDKPRPALKRMGSATCLEEYFLNLLPDLPLAVHKIIRNYPAWQGRPELKDFFPVINRRAEAGED